MTRQIVFAVQNTQALSPTSAWLGRVVRLMNEWLHTGLKFPAVIQ